MADSVIKISADFGQFVSGAKIAEAEIKKLAEDLKSLGVSYKDAMSGAQMKGDALEKTRGVADELKKLGAEFGNAFRSNEGLKRFQSEIDSLSNSLKTSLQPVGAEKLSAEFARLGERVKSALNAHELENFTNTFSFIGGALKKGTAEANAVADGFKKIGDALKDGTIKSSEAASGLKQIGESVKANMNPADVAKFSAEFDKLANKLQKKPANTDKITKEFRDLLGGINESAAESRFKRIGESVKASMNPAYVAKFSAEFDKLTAKLKSNPAEVGKITKEFKELASGVQSSIHPADLDRFNNKLKEVAANYERAVKTLAKGFDANRLQDSVTGNTERVIQSIAKRGGMSVDEVRKQLVALEQEGEKANSVIGRLFARFKQPDSNNGVRAYDDAIRALHRNIVETHGSYEKFLRSMRFSTAIDKYGYGRQIENIATLSPTYNPRGGAASNLREIEEVRRQLVMLDADTSKLGVTAGKTSKQFGSIGKAFKAKSLRSDLNSVSEGFGALGYNLAYLTTQFRGMSSAMLGLTTRNALIVLPFLLSGLAQWRKEITEFDLASLTGGAFARGKFDLTYAQEQVKALGRAYGATKEGAQAAFAEIARASRMPANLINPMLNNLKKLQAYMGNGFKIEGAKRTLYELSQAFTITDHGDGLDALRNFLNKLNGLDEETKQQITNLHNLAAATDDYGKKTEYLGQILDIVVGQANKMKTDGLTPLNDAVMNLKTAFLDLFNEITDSKPWKMLRDFAVDTINFIAGIIKILPTIWENFVPDASVIADRLSNSFKYAINSSILGSAFPGIGDEVLEYVKNSFSDAGKDAAASIDATFGDVAERIAAMASRVKAVGEGKMSAKTALDIDVTMSADKLNREIDALMKAAQEKAQKVAKESGHLDLDPPEKPTKKGGGGGGKSGLDEGERYLQRLREQYDQVSKMNELQRLEYDILNGKVKLNAVQIEQARELAAAIVERKDAEEAAKRAQELAILADEKRLQLQEKIAEYARKLASYYQADSVVDYAEQIAKFEEERNKINRNLNNDERKEIFQAEIAGATPEQIQRIKGYYEELRKLENVRISEDLKAFIEWLEKDTANKQNWNLGIVKAIENVGDWGKEAFADMQKAAENWIHGMSDALADFVRTGKADFKSLANSILDDIARMASKQFIGALFESFSPKGSGGGGAGNAIVNFFKSLFGFASGGYTGNGGKYQAAGIVHKGEYVINADSVRRIGLPFLNALNGFSGGGYVSPAIVNRGVAANDTTVQVNIYNNTTDDVVARRNGTTGALDVIINRSVDAVAASIASGGTVASAMQGTYGLNRGVGLARIGR